MGHFQTTCTKQLSSVRSNSCILGGTLFTVTYRWKKVPNDMLVIDVMNFILKSHEKRLFPIRRGTPGLFYDTNQPTSPVS